MIYKKNRQISISVLDPLACTWVSLHIQVWLFTHTIFDHVQRFPQDTWRVQIWPHNIGRIKFYQNNFTTPFPSGPWVDLKNLDYSHNYTIFDPVPLFPQLRHLTSSNLAKFAVLLMRTKLNKTHRVRAFAVICVLMYVFLKCMSNVDWNNSASFFGSPLLPLPSPSPQIKLGGPSQ